jgi:hypothetical protein
VAICLVVLAGCGAGKGKGEGVMLRSSELSRPSLEAGKLRLTQRPTISADPDGPAGPAPPPNHVEATPIVFPPGSDTAVVCPSGRMLVSLGTPGATLFSAELPCALGHDPSACPATDAQPRVVEVPVTPPPSYTVPSQRVCTSAGCQCVGPSTVVRYSPSFTDSTIARTGATSAAHVHAGISRVGDPTNNCAPINNNSLALARVSDNCGATWSPTFPLDPLVGIPRDPVAGQMQNGPDMPYLYFDPYDPARPLYLIGSYIHCNMRDQAAGRCSGITSDTVLNRSLDGGRSWAFQSFVRQDRAVGFLINNTQCMTSTPDATLFVFGCRWPPAGVSTVNPILLWSHDQGLSWSSFDVSPRPDGESEPLMCGVDGELQNGNGLTLSLARVLDDSPSGMNTVRVGYQFAPAGMRQQQYRTVTVDVPSRGSKKPPRVRSEYLLLPPPGGSIYHARLIEKRIYGPQAPGAGQMDDLAMLEWTEIGGDGAHIERSQLHKGAAGWSAPGVLSGGCSAEGCSNDTWRPARPGPRGSWFGDWTQQGTAYFSESEGKWLFLPMWTQRHAEGYAGDNLFLHFNVLEP